MKFNNRLENDKIVSYYYIRKNIFGYIKESIYLALIKNDSYLKKEFSFLDKNFISNSVLYERGKNNISKLKKFKEEKYTITYIYKNELKKFQKIGFTNYIKNNNSAYDYCLWRQNK